MDLSFKMHILMQPPYKYFSQLKNNLCSNNIFEIIKSSSMSSILVLFNWLRLIWDLESANTLLRV